MNVFLRVLAIALCAILVLPASDAACDEINETFDDALFEPGTFQTTEPDGYTITVTSGKVLFTKSEGTGNGFSRLSTIFTVKGDFVVTVFANRTNASGTAVIGLASSHLGTGGFTDVYFSGANQVISNIFVGAVNESVPLNDSANPVTFRIRRIGNRLIHECDPGLGYVHVSEATDPVLAGPVTFGLFLGQEGDHTVAHAATFDNFFLRGDSFSPPCGNGVLEDGEACDDDDPAWAPGEFCNASCAVLACGDADDSGTITATDALIELRTSVGTSTCDDCVCDVDSSGGGTAITATDALRVLRKSVGLPGDMVCPPCA